MWVKFFHLTVRSFDLHNNGPPPCESAFLIWISIHHRRPLLAGGEQTSERTCRLRSSFRFRIFFALDGHEGQKKRTLELYGSVRQTKHAQEQLQLLSVNRVHAVNHEPSKPELSSAADSVRKVLPLSSGHERCRLCNFFNCSTFEPPPMTKRSSANGGDQCRRVALE